MKVISMGTTGDKDTMRLYVNLSNGQILNCVIHTDRRPLALSSALRDLADELDAEYLKENKHVETRC